MDNQIHLVANRWECLDGVILHSKHRHDFVEHVDEQGNYYFCDGGNGYYIRTSGNLIDKCVRSTDPFELQREFFVWASYGKDGKQDKTYIALKDLTDEHLITVCETQIHLPEHIKELFKNEIRFRRIEIKE